LKDSRAEAKTYALKLLSYRSRSRKEMVDKLKRKGFSATLSKSTINFLEGAGLMDDKALASELFSFSTENKHLGKRGIRMFMTERGISKELIDKILSKHSFEMEEKAAKELLDNKLRTLQDYPNNVIKRRIWSMLQRRGFSFDVMNRVIRLIK
jgi:regulatory protein